MIRGYYEGRYRNDVLAALQAEARIQVRGRSGAVLFLGAGQVAPRLGGLEFGAFHPSAGFAVADGSTGLYFNLGEAF